ncbi:MAG: exodeoxyribonuclease VII large subunit [uncultured bacterium]|nr:MAG: exodeoxyribonuclease VII large subunit [uncultured bacterium]HBD04880.1 exodeoxyribonuclease VII large subunit [Candidatus Uhrbacteria bacterium]
MIMEEQTQILEVHEYLALINESLRVFADTITPPIEGEASDVRVSQDKWVSFDLKDPKEQAVLKCFTTTWKLGGVKIEEGARVRVNGYPKVYERFGMLKLNVEKLEFVGEGQLKKAYEALKKRLAQEGVFDASRKRALVRFPLCIGLITSRDAAAYGDFLRILSGRMGGLTILHANVHVQGANAVSDIVNAFDMFNSMQAEDRPEVIVLTRGGGGLEDLHAFNDEQTARAVFASKIPVVCGVGHERDESLCDFAADVRASTPSNAAEIIVPSRREVENEISMMIERMASIFNDSLSSKMSEAVHSANVFVRDFEARKQDADALLSNLLSSAGMWAESMKSKIISSARLIDNVNPRKVLERGYSITRIKGRALISAHELVQGNEVDVQLHKGSFISTVKTVKS